jgi:hypothetical protein
MTVIWGFWTRHAGPDVVASYCCQVNRGRRMGSDSVGDPRHIDVVGPSECAIVPMMHSMSPHSRARERLA